MRDAMLGINRSGIVGLLLGTMLVLTGPAVAQALKPASPQPTTAVLKPGLSVCYIFAFVRHINEMLDWEKHKKCEPGEPLLELNYSVGGDNVLTSNSDDAVLARIVGLIRFDKPGSYGFAFESNDGVRLEIAGQRVVEDPDVHADRFSDIGTVEIAEPGWYDLTIRYFERKNTSTLRFFWSPPGTEGSMPRVPAANLAHLPAAAK